jgi:hypothetical protein
VLRSITRSRPLCGSACCQSGSGGDDVQRRIEAAQRELAALALEDPLARDLVRLLECSDDAPLVRESAAIVLLDLARTGARRAAGHRRDPSMPAPADKPA